MRSIYEVIEEINTKLSAGISYGNNTFHNLCVKTVKNDQTLIITRKQGSIGSLISPSNLRNMIFYHRIIDEGFTPTKSGKGSNTYTFQNTVVRLVGIGRRKNISNASHWDNQEFLNEAVRVLNSNTRLSDKETVTINNRSSDWGTVMGEELDDEEKWKQLKLEMVVFYVDYTVQKRVVC